MISNNDKMNYQKLLLATLGGAVAFFFSGFLMWGIVLGSIQQNHTLIIEKLVKPQPDMVLMAIGMVVFSFLFSLIYHRWAGIKTFKTGAIAGAVIAILYGFGYDLMMLAQMNLIDNVVLLTDILANAVWGALGGGVIGWILGRGED